MELRDYLRAVLGVERVGAWLVAIVAVAAIATVVTAGVPTVGGPPAAEFDVAYDNATQQYTVTHGGGDLIDDGESLTLTVSDGQHTANLTWAGEGGVTTFPVRSGDSVSVDDPRVDSDDDGDYFDADATVGFALDGNETITVRWTGRPLGAPDTRTVVLSGE